MAAVAHLVIPAQSKQVTAPSAEADGPALRVFSAEGARAEPPLTSEPPLPDAEAPLTSEPPLADATPLTSESDAICDSCGGGL